MADILVKSFQPIGKVRGMGEIQIEAAEIISPEREMAFHSVRFTITGSGDYPSQKNSAVAFTDVPRLLAAIDKLAAVKINTERFQQTEVTASIDGLQITVFNHPSGKMYTAISSAGTSCVFTSQSQLAEIKKLVTAAQHHLEKVQVG